MEGVRKVRMVDVSAKPETVRIARARGCIELRRETIERIERGGVEKGDVLTVSSVVAMNAVKSLPSLLPFCHPLRIDHIDVEFFIDGNRLCVEVEVRTRERTGAEMEALYGVLAALLNVWDMVKKYEKDETGNYPSTRITDVVVLRKVKLDAERSQGGTS